MKDTYNVIADESYGEYKEKGSKFQAYAYPVRSVDEVEIYLDDLRSQHPKARHFCYAYRIGLEGEEYRANDDGEPSGTAGKPILGQLLSFEVSDTFIVVVRYFGGTKLGASGLISAYKQSASEALNASKIKERVLTKTFRIQFDYAEMGHVLNVIKNLDLEITNKYFEAIAYVDIELPLSRIDETLVTLKANLLQISEEQINEETDLKFCTINELDS